MGYYSDVAVLAEEKDFAELCRKADDIFTAKTGAKGLEAARKNGYMPSIELAARMERAARGCIVARFDRVKWFGHVYDAVEEASREMHDDGGCVEFLRVGSDPDDVEGTGTSSALGTHIEPRTTIEVWSDLD